MARPAETSAVPGPQVGHGSVFRAGPVTVTVPATSANLGPGFDSLGLALQVRDTLVGEVVPGGLDVLVHGEGADDVPTDERHLVVRAMRTAFEAMGVHPSGLRLECTNVIPHSRGMGSSSAAIVGGLVLARALVLDGAERLSEHDLLVLANRLEGHPDNVAPALLGGFVIAGHDEHEVWAAPSPLAPELQAVVLVPPVGVRTEAARGLLPGSVTHCDAAANAGRSALLVAALAGAREHLWRATEDFLHQQARRPAMPETLALVDRLREQQVAAVVSGAGPTVLALVVGAEEVEAVLQACPAGWTALAQVIGGRGATVLP